MKKNIFIIVVMMLLIFSGITIEATTDEPTIPVVRLPTESITMYAQYGDDSWFDMTLSDIPAGYDIQDGTYLGWCAQKDTMMRRGVNHAVILYSSYDPFIAEQYCNNSWEKINYVLNHKQGGRDSIEKVIWYYTCDDAYPTDPLAQAMISDTEAHYQTFVPQPGDIIAIFVQGIDEIQQTFFELHLRLPSPIGDLVWNDDNANGIQDEGEPGIAGISVTLYTNDDTEVDSMITDIHGYYSFAYFPTGEYYLRFVLPSGYRFSPKHQGDDSTKDSDVNPESGNTDVAMFSPDDTDMSWDAGMYVPDVQGNPVRRNHGNRAPSADGSAGEPYTGFIGEEILFNGSYSYDLDGTIVSYHWTFGEGNSADGMVVSHAYTTDGTYNVFLRVTDNRGAQDAYSTIARIRVPNRPPLQPQVRGPFEGLRNASYVYSIVTTDPDNDDIRYMIEWGDGSQNTSPSFRSGHSIHTMHQWSAAGFYLLRVYATDTSNATSAVYQVVVGIDRRYVGSLGYLMNTDSAGPYDMFYSNETGNMTVVQLQQNGVYLIDTNGDGSVDYQFNVDSSSLRAYPEQLGNEYLLLLVGLGVVILLIVLWSFLAKRKKNKSA